MAQKSNIPQSKDALIKSYLKRLKDDLRAMMENFHEILICARYDEEGQALRMTRSGQERLEAHVRAANLVRAAESLTRLIADIKQFLVLNDFPVINDSITLKTKYYRTTQVECDNKLMTLRDELASELYELEEEYYSSIYK